MGKENPPAPYVRVFFIHDGRNMDIKRSKKLNDGVCVWFDNGWYYAHSISEIGEPTDPDNGMNSMWSWINHMRHKRWWSPYLEARFIREVKKHF